ncbi:MAG TPA: hypothetical protein VHL99_00310 [Candidatus Binatia bacterium]|nr:hypothetical protein [Candidatus Binatia bacterium]
MDKGSSNTKVTVVAVLALAQAILAVLRSLHWFDIGSDLMDRGILILPAIAVFAYVRGLLVSGIALLYVLFVVGEFSGRGWGRTCGAVAAILNLLLVFGAVVEGEALLRAILWAVVPVIILWRVFSSSPAQVEHARAA